MRRSTTREEILDACALSGRAAQELFTGYLPFLDQMTKIAQGTVPFDPERIRRFRESLTPVTGRAAYALRLGDELAQGVVETAFRPTDDPRVAAPLIRAMLESVLAALAVQSVEELRATPLASRRQLRELLEEPLLKLWLSQHLPVAQPA